ncbi:MAG: DUF115 domain-containing protein [Treponema sp.]|nr:DUF115 domain-containing protein [Treponema sp.]
MLGAEAEPELADFIQQNHAEYQGIPNFSFLTKEEMLDLGPLLSGKNTKLASGFELPEPGTFRRIVRIDFSAASALNDGLYNQIYNNGVNAIMTYWANRVTLVKFGRKYCTNFFKNLACLEHTTPIQKFFASVDKTILVFGAGESVARGISLIKSSANGQKDFFIICADTALQPLIASGIEPDGVFIEEAQNVISKCFIGVQNYKTQVFAGLSAIHSITRYFKPEQISFFTTEFVQARFIERFKQAGILPPGNDPFGSVGITAFYYAMLFRKNDQVQIKTFGLDFAYSAGRTHTKGTMADNARFMSSNRVKNDANYTAAFCEPAFKKNDTMYTTPILARYEQIMCGLPRLSQNDIASYKKDCRVKPDNDTGVYTGELPRFACNDILQEEAASLEKLKSLLTGQTKLPADQMEKQITELVQDREYLFLHFPDGQKFAYTQSFLNRIRVEIDYYLKILKR